MKQIIFYFTICFFVCCNERSDNEIKVEDTLVPPTLVRHDSTITQDHHTTYTDVIDNLFVFINKKDWKTVGDFYRQPGMNTYFFSKLIDDHDLSGFELMNILKKEDRVYVITKGKKKDGTEVPMCFLFDIENNRIVGQEGTKCLHDR